MRLRTCRGRRRALRRMYGQWWAVRSGLQPSGKRSAIMLFGDAQAFSCRVLAGTSFGINFPRTLLLCGTSLRDQIYNASGNGPAGAGDTTAKTRSPLELLGAGARAGWRIV